MTTPSDCITVRAAAAILGISTARAYQLIDNGKLPARRLTLRGPLVIERADVLTRKEVAAAIRASQSVTP